MSRAIRISSAIIVIVLAVLTLRDMAQPRTHFFPIYGLSRFIKILVMGFLVWYWLWHDPDSSD